MTGGFTVTARVGPKVVKERFDALDEALAALALHVADGAGRGGAEPRREILGRTYEPGQQVTGRIELRGPGVRGGIDVRGDGSAEAYRGWIRKRLIAAEPGETAADALARELSRRA